MSNQIQHLLSICPPSTYGLLKRVYDTNPLPTDLAEQLRPVISATGLTKFKATNKYYKYYDEIVKRLHSISEIFMYHCEATNTSNYDADLIALIQDQYPNLAYHYAMLQKHYRLLDISNFLNHTNPQLKELYKEWNLYTRTYSQKAIRADSGVPEKEPQFQDEVTMNVLKCQENARRGLIIQRLNNACIQADKKGWYFVFDTLTLADDQIDNFYNDSNALRDYTRRVGRLVNESIGRSKRESYQDVYQYFCVPEFGGQTGRLHFHVLHMMAELPLNTVDPNQGRRIRNATLVKTMHGLWPYGQIQQAIAVRYKNDAYTKKRRWLMPVDPKTGEAKPLKPIIAVSKYIAKYVCKNTDIRVKSKLANGAEKWKITLQHNYNLTTESFNKVFKVRMSRGFGKTLPTMDNLHILTLVQLTKLCWTTTPLHRVVKENAQKQLALRLGTLSIENMLELTPETNNLLTALRTSMNQTQPYNLQKCIDTTIAKLTNTDISDETKDYLEGLPLTHGITRFEQSFGGK